MFRFAAVAAVAGLLGGSSLVPTAAGALARVWQADEIASMLQSGESVLLEDGSTIKGPLRIGDGPVRGAFVCRRCTLLGSLNAARAQFERGIDLSGSTVRGQVLLQGAFFAAPARFGAPAGQSNATSKRACEPINQIDRIGASFGANVDFAFATFGDIADFEGVIFCRAADFTSAHFRHQARFGSAEFQASSLFRATRFDEEGSFARGLFGGPADFEATTFGGVADFRQTSFGAPTDVNPLECRQTVCFQDAVFRGRADFSRAKATAPAFFRDAHFAADALFRRTSFDFAGNEYSVSFDSTTIIGRLDLEGATLSGSAQLSALSARELVLRDTNAEDAELAAQGVRVSELVANSLDPIERVSGDADRAPLLRALESSAKARGDLRLANDAHFRLQELASRDDSLPRRVADLVLYKTIAGYLVRPLRPLGWLVGLIAFATLLRVFRPGSPGEKVPDGGKQDGTASGDANPRARLVRQFGSGTSRVVRAVWLTITGREETSPLRRAELLVYAFLLACFLLALANTNPTLRDMIDAIS